MVGCWVKYLLTIFSSSIAYGFIPSSSMILERTAANHGHGLFVVEQEVHFPNGQTTFALRETWLVENGNSMKVTVRGLKEWRDEINFTILYKGNQRYFIDSQGQKQVGTIKPLFFEPLFHCRSAENLSEVLYEQQILPKGSIKKNINRITNIKEPIDSALFIEQNVRIARNGGVASYAFGRPTPAQSRMKNPGMWIEQDKFVLRRLRFADGSEVRADEYLQLQNNLFFPKSRVVMWEQFQANIQVISVKPSVNRQFDMQNLQLQHLTQPSKTNGLNKLAIKDTIIEFYSRYR